MSRSHRLIPVRDEKGRIIRLRRPDEVDIDSTLFADTLASTMVAVAAPDDQVLVDLLDAPAAPAPARPGRRRITRYDVAAVVIGLLVLVAVIGAVNTFAPERPRPLALATARPAAAATARGATVTPVPSLTATAPPTSTPRPTDTPVPAPTPELPSQEPIIIIQSPPCDPLVNPRFVVRLDLPPYGSATGVSCSSLEEAQANADAYAAQVLAAQGVTATP